MNEINVSIIENIGGWFNLEIATMDEIVSTPIILTNSNANQVVFDPNDDGIDVLPIGDTIVVNESQKITDNGVEYSIDIRFDINHQSADIEDFFAKYLNKDVVAVGIKLNGDKRMYGSKKYPLRLTYGIDNGNRFEQSNQTSIRITGNIPQKPVFVIANTSISSDSNTDNDNADSGFESA